MILSRDFTSLNVSGARAPDWTERGGRDELEQDRLDKAYNAGMRARAQGEAWMSRVQLDTPPDEVEEWGQGWDDMDHKMSLEGPVYDDDDDYYD